MKSLSRRNFIAATLAAGAGSAALMQVAPAMAADDARFPADPAQLKPGLEAAHTPRIELEKAPAEQVAFGKTRGGDFYRVSVQARHEATPDHHIFDIALFVNGRNVAQYRMDPAQAGASMPLVVAVERLQLGDVVTAITDCNLHGKWGNRLTV